jgi:hypothetical protein
MRRLVGCLTRRLQAACRRGCELGSDVRTVVLDYEYGCTYGALYEYEYEWVLFLSRTADSRAPPTAARGKRGYLRPGG